MGHHPVSAPGFGRRIRLQVWPLQHRLEGRSDIGQLASVWVAVNLVGLPLYSTFPW